MHTQCTTHCAYKCYAWKQNVCPQLFFLFFFYFYLFFFGYHSEHRPSTGTRKASFHDNAA